jgi:hypothetical protein
VADRYATRSFSLPPVSGVRSARASEDGHEVPLNLLFGKGAYHVIHCFAAFEEIEGGHAPYPVFRGSPSVFVHIEGDEFRLPCVFPCQFIQNRGQSPAVPSPGGGEIEKDRSRMVKNLGFEGGI